MINVILNCFKKLAPDTWYSGLQRLFKIFDNNTGIHNKLLDENGKLRTYLKLNIIKHKAIA
jgi:hypothetical protein